MKPHQGQVVLRTGAPFSKARAALLLIHGRGGSARDILGLGEAVAGDARDVALVAPEAEGASWYPQRFLLPRTENEPYLQGALDVVDGLVREVTAAGVPFESLVFIGFSQGGCLSLDYAETHRRRYGGVFGLSGALIGPLDAPRTGAGSLDGTPVYLGCSEHDPFIPLEHVERTAEVMENAGAKVTTSIFKGNSHAVTAEELAAMRALLQGLRAPARGA